MNSISILYWLAIGLFISFMIYIPLLFAWHTCVNIFDINLWIHAIDQFVEGMTNIFHHPQYDYIGELLSRFMLSFIGVWFGIASIINLLHQDVL